jgi:hypothetical protein
MTPHDLLPLATVGAAGIAETPVTEEQIMSGDRQLRVETPRSAPGRQFKHVPHS